MPNAADERVFRGGHRFTSFLSDGLVVARAFWVGVWARNASDACSCSGHGSRVVVVVVDSVAGFGSFSLLFNFCMKDRCFSS